MAYEALREELKKFYWTEADPRSDRFNEECTALLDEAYREGMSAYEMKGMQYRLITERFDPVLFLNSPFYYETGTMCAQCDGAGEWRQGHNHPGGWTYRKNFHKFKEKDPLLWEALKAQREEQFYLIGPYRDTRQHFRYNYRPVFEHGLKGVYQKAQGELQQAKTEEEREFLSSLCDGLLCLKRMSEKFAEKAFSLLSNAPEEAKSNLERIAQTAKRVPWERPETFYEALNTYAFLRKAVGSLEGVGLNSFGRVDMDLYPFYQKDLERGVLTEEEAYGLICQFLISFDLCYDHDMKMVKYSDHEMENTYVLGGCDKDGNPFCNQLTLMFLRATREEKILFPKIKCRFSKHSSKEYLDEINKAVIAGTSSVLYQNDGASIPPLVRSGKPLEEARDYLVSGCWDMGGNGTEKPDAGTYVNMIKPFEFSLHPLDDRMKKVGMEFESLDGAKDFETVYRITCRNINTLFRERARVTREGNGAWSKVDPLMLFSSTLSDCIENHADFTENGARYHNDIYMCFGFPEIVDSLLAIKELCFDQKVCSLSRLLSAVRNNWEGEEDLRIQATRCRGWGDGSEESCQLAKRFYEDLAAMLESLTATCGGKVLMGFLTYTEIRWWGENTLATPNGRKNGEYFAQGLTPSRLKKIPSVTDVIHSMTYLDASLMGGNSVINVILPSDRITLDLCESFLRAVADSAVQSLQLNCTTKEQLLDAQKHPEKYPDLIVRVTGFSAKFTSLSPEWQQEVLTRNFYE